MRKLTGVSWAVAAVTAAALLVTSAPASAGSTDALLGVTGSASTGSSGTGSGGAQSTTPVELPPMVAAGSGYAAELKAAVDYWTVDRLAQGGLNDDNLANGLDGQGSDVIVEPTAGGDALSATFTGQGQIRKTAGKLLLKRTKPRSADYVLTSCSANVVSSANQSVVLTAAHCLRMDSSNWDFGTGIETTQTVGAVFIPGFDGAALARHVPGSDGGTTMPGTDIAPYGVWGVTRAWITNGWAADASQFGEGPGHDMAAFLVDSPTDSRPIQQVTGGQQVGFNLPQGKVLTGFGYPSDNIKSWYAPPMVDGVPTRTGAANRNGVPSELQRSFDGRTLKVSSGQTTGIASRYLDVLPAAISPGASGGPWFEQYDPATGTGIQVAVTSHFVNADGGLPVLETVLANMNSARPYMSATHFVDQEKAVYDLAQAQVAPN
ncbi:trypsin-like serine peptidase [Rhodococcus sp. UNC363MFTsu5.1]|uniref:trypsin-like serine peptidase n=1 Tax=Rhodococcus sp. UNC363MFTsu5.1 TaxID=1449069 RepID=UPI0012DFD911|nr:trypsin-like peptidase domain-containing protein [Rhodococcus sp. UNC363MFTsu5.1]